MIRCYLRVCVCVCVSVCLSARVRALSRMFAYHVPTTPATSICNLALLLLFRHFVPQFFFKLTACSHIWVPSVACDIIACIKPFCVGSHREIFHAIRVPQSNQTGIPAGSCQNMFEEQGWQRGNFQQKATWHPTTALLVLEINYKAPAILRHRRDHFEFFALCRAQESMSQTMSQASVSRALI